METGKDFRENLPPHWKFLNLPGYQSSKSSIFFVTMNYYKWKLGQLLAVLYWRNAIYPRNIDIGNLKQSLI